MNKIFKSSPLKEVSLRVPRQRTLAAAIALGITLAVASSASAVDYPDVPLQSGTSYPAANVLFILDDSGSMSSAAMPDDDDRPLSDTVARKSYVQNTIYYNPTVSYEPWIKADNTRYTTGKSYTSVWDDSDELITAVDLSSGTQTYYVPITPFAANATTTQKNTLSNYYRYQIRKVSSVMRVERSTYRSKSGGNDYGQAGCGTNDNWQNCTTITPSGGTSSAAIAAEIQNFAIWYSYHSTRLKVAKAGGSEAFAQMPVPQNIRVGFTKISQTPGAGAGILYPIPVGTAGGVFSNTTNRTTWFNYLQGVSTTGSTPLRWALTKAGEYFKTAAPWGPETGTAQFTCRQNFSILTTDGFWNDDTNGTTFTNTAGDADGTSGVAIADASGDSAIRYTPILPYRDGATARSNTLADVAMKYWKDDLRTDMINNVPNRSDNPAFWQHMTTFGVSIGLRGSLDPTIDLPSITNGSKVWPNPLDAFDNHRIDDLWHASVNGRGKFIVAADSDQFATALSDALTSIAERLGSASNVTANSSSFVTDSAVYQASYTSGKWSGEVTAYGATAAGVAATPSWQASQKIPATGRKIFTWSGSAGTAFPTVAQTTALARPGGLAPVTGADNAAYIAGTRTLERKFPGGTLRNRDTVLGDIVNSSPAYVEDNKTLFVGSNDGMLHAFDSLTGVEKFAYVPGGISISNLASLSDPSYTHKYFVDGPVVVSTQKQTLNKNYLVGALGRGGKGVYGLDVTTPNTFSASDVEWELSSDTDMGQVLGTPLIVKLNTNVSAVIVSNGINSSSGEATLFVVNIATGAVIKKIKTGISGDNGLSAPRGWDIDANGTVDSIYAGDLKGNLWKFDLSSTNSADWEVANSGDPLFIAERSSVRQPISAGLSLAKEPGTGRLWVLFGTGRFISSLDSTNANVQSLYGIIDSGSVVGDRSDLQEREIVASGTVNGNRVRAFETYSTLPSGKEGWFIDLDNPTAGERVDTDPRIRNRALVVSSILPATAGNTCEATGSGYLNALDAFTGTSLQSGFFGAPYSGNVLTTSGGVSVPVGSVDLGVGMPTRAIFIDNLAVVGGSNGGLSSITTTPSGLVARRVSWRELIGD